MPVILDPEHIWVYLLIGIAATTWYTANLKTAAKARHSAKVEERKPTVTVDMSTGEIVD